METNRAAPRLYMYSFCNDVDSILTEFKFYNISNIDLNDNIHKWWMIEWKLVQEEENFINSVHSPLKKIIVQGRALVFLVCDFNNVFHKENRWHDGNLMELSVIKYLCFFRNKCLISIGFRREFYCVILGWKDQSLHKFELLFWIFLSAITSFFIDHKNAFQ